MIARQTKIKQFEKQFRGLEPTNPQGKTSKQLINIRTKV